MRSVILSKPIVRWQRVILCLFLLVALWPAEVLSETAKPARLSTLLAITGTGQIRSGFDMKVVEAMLVSTEFVNPAIREATGLEPDEWAGLIRIELTPVGARASQMSVTVLPDEKIDEPTEVAGSVMQALTSRVISSFNGLNESQTEDLDREYNEQLALEKKIKQQITSTELELRKHSRTSGIAGYGGRDAKQQERARKIESLTTALLAQRTRLQAIRRVIDEIKEEWAANSTEDRLLLELIDARSQLLKELESQETPDTLRLAEAKEKLAEARYELDKQHKGLFEAHINRWESRLVDMRVELAQTESQLELLEAVEREQAEDQGDASEPLMDRAELEIQLQSDKRQMQNIQQKLRDIDRARSQIGLNPKLIVMSDQSTSGPRDDASHD